METVRDFILEGSKITADGDSSHEITPGLPVHHQFPEFTQTHVH